MTANILFFGAVFSQVDFVYFFPFFFFCFLCVNSYHYMYISISLISLDFPIQIYILRELDSMSLLAENYYMYRLPQL